jgi:hypothetical protein
MKAKIIRLIERAVLGGLLALLPAQVFGVGGWSSVLYFGIPGALIGIAFAVLIKPE